MNHQVSKSNPGIKGVPNNTGDAGRVEEQYKSIQVMIPMELDRKNRVFGFFALDNEDLPEGSQKNLNEITGTPFKAELAGLTVIAGPVVQTLQENYSKALFRLADSIDQCDKTTHSQNTALWAKRIAETMRLADDEVVDISLAGRLHDIGKSVISREVLSRTGPLTTDEWAIIRRHPELGATLMKPSLSLSPIIPMVLAHHERFDGTGYPNRLAGQDIPLGGRILAVADSFSSMINGRNYRPAISIQSAQSELVRCSGSQFDPEIVKIIIQLLRRF
ncbi:HD-GYP domain-containing protein [Leptolinea tardivitalis]|uniref:HD-GYP domain-containing protein n=1 Tax=Leptolinea tardivitalis TaxID=229920 RepID=UPI00078556B2|nr:HD domain-containing phosphohydrolase [Leptolinea tardivitalis]GAP22004.1 response regulator containing a CheY-like receiver domain and an HD-GYP domain [Leptolinea tardivitalis]